MDIPSIQDILDLTKLHPYRLKNAYIFGSRIYGNYNDKSDWDVLVIANTPSPETEFKSDILNVHVLSAERFKDGLKQHNIRNIECILSPDWAKLKEDIKFPLEIKENSLRHSISHINSNSWVKARKKLEQGDYEIGIKSLYHSIRIPMFGIQISTTGTIYNWSCANHIWKKLKKKVWTWSELESEFKKLNNNTMSDFRKVTNKK